jgi:inorganic pyrophosphatase
MHPWHDVELPRYVEDTLPAIIEIPTGSKVKYELDKRSGLLMVDRVLFSSVHYPANYGFVPRTYCDDGDPLDILVYCEETIQPLAIMRAKVIGVMRMRDDKGQDDKLIAVHADDPNFADYGDIGELPVHRLRELKRFFEDYKVLENKKVTVSDPQPRSEGLAVLRDAIRLYDRERDRLAGRKADASSTPRPRGRAGRSATARRR